MGVKGVKPAPIVFFYLSLSLRKSLIMPPKTCCNENFRIQIPSKSYMYMKDIIWLSITDFLNNKNNDKLFY